MASELVATRYELRERIGAGGVAVVYRAFDRRLERDVALKVLRSEYAADAEFLTRFEREARIAAGLNHRNIVRVDDYGQHDDTFFIAMEHVDGPNLKEYVRVRGRLAPDEAVRIAGELLSALAAAHRQGLVHRDVKPQNVLLGRDGAPGADGWSAKLTDFGIARMPSVTQVTQLGTTLGTAAYVAPEQASGQVVGPAADLYGVGLLLYEMLTGRPPFEGDSPAAVLYRHVHEAPRPPRQLRPELPPALEAVVLRALEKEPARRFGSAEEMAEALRVALSAPHAAVPPSTQAAMASANTVVLPEVPAAPRPTPTWSAAPAAPPPAPDAPPPARRRAVPLWPFALIVGLIVLGGLIALTRSWEPTAGATATPAVAATAAAVPSATPSAAAPAATPAVPTPSAVAPTAAPTAPAATPRPSPPAPTTTPRPSPPAPTATAPAPTRPPSPTALAPPKPGAKPGLSLAPIALEDTAFQGGFRNPGASTYRQRSATWIYGARTPYASMSATFQLPGAPTGGALLTIVGLDSENAPKTPISISINDRELFRGPAPFADDTHSQDFENAPAPWGERSWPIPAEALRSGPNTLTIRNLADTADVGTPPFFVLDQARVTFS
jgi:serine/threonine-protein kinase